MEGQLQCVGVGVRKSSKEIGKGKEGNGGKMEVERILRQRSTEGVGDSRHVMEKILEMSERRERHALSAVSGMWREVDGETRAEVVIRNCYAAHPSQLTRRFKSLKRITIKGRPRADDYGLVALDWGGYAAPWIKEIAKSYPQLQSLRLKRMVVTDDDLAVLSLINLQELTLHLCQQFSTAGLRSVAACRSLKALSLRESSVEDRGAEWLHFLAMNSKVIEVLDIECLDPSSVDVADLERLAGSLESLKVPAETPLRDLKGFLDQAKVLKEFGAGSFDDESSGEDEVGLPGSLISLSGLLNIQDSYLSKLRPITANLVKLDMKATPALTEDGYIFLLSGCDKLENLQVGHHVGDEVLLAIGRHCKKLKRLRFERVVGDEEANLTQGGLLAIADSCPQLQHFLVWAKDMTNEVLCAFGKNCKEMIDFRFVLVNELEVIAEENYDSGVEALLRGCTKLTRLCFYARNGALTDAGLEHIGRYGHNLKWLLLGCAGSSAGQGMRHLGPGAAGGGCRKLEKLELRDCPLTGKCIADSILPMFPTDLIHGSHYRLRYLWFQGNKLFSEAEILALHGNVKPPLYLEVMLPRPAAANGYEIQGNGPVCGLLPLQLFAYCSVAGPRADLPPTAVLL